MIKCALTKLHKTIIPRNGGKYLPLLTDTEGNNDISIYNTSE